MPPIDARQVLMTGMDVLPISADVSTPAGCEQVIEATRAGLGPVEILVDNAGSSAQA